MKVTLIQTWDAMEIRAINAHTEKVCGDYYANISPRLRLGEPTSSDYIIIEEENVSFKFAWTDIFFLTENGWVPADEAELSQKAVLVLNWIEIRKALIETIDRRNTNSKKLHDSNLCVVPEDSAEAVNQPNKLLKNLFK